jgi:hypothetical protein
MNDDEFNSYQAGKSGFGGATVTGDSAQNQKNHMAYLQGQADAAHQRRMDEARAYVPPAKKKPVKSTSEAQIGKIDYSGAPPRQYTTKNWLYLVAYVVFAIGVLIAGIAINSGITIIAGVILVGALPYGLIKSIF